MQNSGSTGANANPSMMGVAETGGDNANAKPTDPSGPRPLSTMSEAEQHTALTAGQRAAGMFPRSPGKESDSTY